MDLANSGALRFDGAKFVGWIRTPERNIFKKMQVTCCGSGGKCCRGPFD